MSKYTATSLLFGIFLLSTILMYQYLGSHPGWIALTAVIYVVLLSIGSTLIGMNFYFRSINRAKTTERKIAITFDDGPHEKVTDELLKILDKHDAKAAFFFIGKNIGPLSHVVRSAAEKGHIIGNHSYSHHRWFDLFPATRMVSDIEAASAEIEKATGRKPLLFRPPYGVTNPAWRKALIRTEMIPVGWSLRTFDTVRKGNKVLEKLKRKTSPGKVVLFHDRGPELTSIVEEYLEWLKENDFKVVSLTELFSVDAYEPQ